MPISFLAIIKLIEDKMNIDQDVRQGVQVICWLKTVSGFIPATSRTSIRILLRQSKGFITESLNEHQKMVRMRGRPKIILATSYEEADSDVGEI